MKTNAMSMSNLSPRVGYIPSLDGIRALAVLGVIGFHFTFPFRTQLLDTGGLWKWWVHISNNGWLGVDLFFILSGYLIARKLLSSPVTDWPAYARFVNSRARRLLPAYVACLIFINIVALAFTPDSRVLHVQWWVWTFTVNFAQAFGNPFIVSDPLYGLDHFWSLAMEWHFYLLFPLVLMVSKSPVKTALGMLALALCVRLFMLWLLPERSASAAYFFTFARMDGFAFGVLAAARAEHIPPRTLCLFAKVAIGALTVLFVVVGYQSIDIHHSVTFQVIGYTLASGLFATIIAYLATKNQPTPITLWLEHPWLVRIGLISYSLYLWHLVFISIITGWAVKHASNSLIPQFLLSSAINLAFTLVASIISYRLFEQGYFRQRRTLQPRLKEAMT
ncbi:MAG: acyltransferase [Pseudomonadota bacterium]|nr:acyltransferase [Pseudomonadota bacterium]